MILSKAVWGDARSSQIVAATSTDCAQVWVIAGEYNFVSEQRVFWNHQLFWTLRFLQFTLFLVLCTSAEVQFVNHKIKSHPCPWQFVENPCLSLS